LGSPAPPASAAALEPFTREVIPWHYWIDLSSGMVTMMVVAVVMVLVSREYRTGKRHQ
jgi:hypothetical protein